MAEIGFGTATLGREAGDELSLGLLDRAYKLGIRHFDTAEAYGGGNARAYRRDRLGIDDERESSGVMHSAELLLGRWLKSRGVGREIQIATKVAEGFHDTEVVAALERSLERLHLESVEVFYLHRMPPPGQLQSALAGLMRAQETGLCRAIGISNFTDEAARPAKELAPSLRYCQNVFNLAQPGAAHALIPFCQAEAMRFVAYSPLGAGFLTGKYGARGELAPKGTRFDVIPGHKDVYFHSSSFAALEKLEQLSAQTGLPKHLLALAWVLRHPGVAIVLVGATKPEHLDNALEARAVALDSSLWARLEAIGAAS